MFQWPVPRARSFRLTVEIVQISLKNPASLNTSGVSSLQTEPNFSSSFLRHNKGFLLAQQATFLRFLCSLFQKAVWGLVDNLCFALWSHVSASITLGSLRWHIRRQCLFWTSAWVLKFLYKWMPEWFLGWRDKNQWLQKERGQKEENLKEKIKKVQMHWK